ncbi:MAG: DNA polymerase domain-containing protein [Candidatus Hermodarchaeota archaeon]
MSRICGWLHDVKAADWGVYTYWITKEKTIRSYYSLTAEFFIAKTDEQTQKQLLSHPQIESIEKVRRYLSIHDYQPRFVLCLRVNPLKIRSTYQDLRDHWGHYLYNSDLSIWQHFCYQTGLFPYVYAIIEVKNERLLSWHLLETYTQMNYQPIPFRVLWFQPTFEDRCFFRGKILKISVYQSIVDQKEDPVIFEDQMEEETLFNCIRYLHKVDPDILFTSGGDVFLPIVAQRAIQAGVGHLRLGRGSRPLSSYVSRQPFNRGHSFTSYGQVYFSQYGTYLDGGRHHYDVNNSFMWKDGKLEGLLEIARLSCIDPQRIARSTIGTALNAVQMRTAYYRHILIPARKADAEAFRPAWTMQSDVGGLVFSPLVGFHINVTELDFLSMYPNIMVRLNVSPETVNCKCCKGEEQPVPLTNHHICTRRQGLISLSLEHILHRREYFKSQRKQHVHFDQRQKVLKWLLVTCFGYTGYRNARFGRIEAHEAISAYGRHALTLGQQLARDYGLELIAGIVDSMWLKRSDENPINRTIAEELCQRIEEQTKLPVEHAADYYWIVFLPRRHEPEIGSLNRYYGLKTSGTLRIRGIELRKSSSPPFIKKLQQDLLKILAKARDRDQFKVQSLYAREIVKKRIVQLKRGIVPLEELLITTRLSRSPQEYVTNSRSAIAARQLTELGFNAEPGMKLRYLITDAQAKEATKRVKVEHLLAEDELYDVAEYRKLCLKAYEELIPPKCKKRASTLETFLS